MQECRRSIKQEFLSLRPDHVAGEVHFHIMYGPV